MTRLAVTADIHASDFGSRLDPATGLNARFLDAIEMVRWVARDAHARDCDALVVAGDLTEERHPSPWRVAMIAEALAEFPGPFVLVRGNHDGSRAGRSVIDLLGSALPDAHGFSRPGVAWVRRTAVCALPYLDRSWLRAQPGMEAVPDADAYRVLGEQYLTIARGLLARARAERPDLDDAVLVVHQGLSGGHMSDVQQAFLGDLSLVVDTGALAAIGFDAILAGHFHLGQTLRRDPLIAYAGAPLRTDFGEEGQAKSYLVVDTRDPSAFEVVPTPARRFVTIRGSEPVPDVAGAIVRGVDLEPSVDLVALRRDLDVVGAFEVASLAHARDDSPVSSGGMSEGLSAFEALEAYFAADDDRERLVATGREILQAVAA